MTASIARSTWTYEWRDQDVGALFAIEAAEWRQQPIQPPRVSEGNVP